MEIDNFIKKIEKKKSKDNLDLSDGEDLSVALMNLVSLEEHCFFSYVKTNDEKFLSMLDKARESRKKMLKLIVKDDDGSEKWCMSKHFLASSMRLYEVGNRLLHEGKEKEAKDMYKEAAELYGLFWVLNTGKSKSVVSENSSETKKEEKKTVFGSIKEMLKCCLE